MIRPARQARTRALIASLALGGAMLLSVGCETGSSDSTTATLSDNAGRHYNFSGHYANHNDANEALPLVYPSGRQSGQALMWIRLLQSGSVLEAYDDAGETWSGGISSIANETAQFTLQGRTSAGAPVNIAGALRYADQSSTMDATWIEPTFSGNLVATAAVASPTQSATPSGGDSGENGDTDGAGDSGGAATDLTITPPGRWFIPNAGISGDFTASGGTPPYTWYVSATVLGTVSPMTGVTVTYTTTQQIGTNIIRVVDASGAITTALAEYH
ncbi:MAG: hypothetical protein RBT03_09520 [Kiritimatiellia bacterium]|jgi:hypothetical protein|nr:hypothetical protein [Kiritimatiellia bacterium]